MKECVRNICIGRAKHWLTQYVQTYLPGTRVSHNFLIHYTLTKPGGEARQRTSHTLGRAPRALSGVLDAGLTSQRQADDNWMDGLKKGREQGKLCQLNKRGLRCGWVLSKTSLGASFLFFFFYRNWGKTPRDCNKNRWGWKSFTIYSVARLTKG